MKIAHICLSIGFGGAEKLLVDSLPRYVEQGHDITVIQLSSCMEETSYINALLAANIKVITLSKGSFMSFSTFLKLVKIMKANEHDIIHVHLFPCFYYISIASRLIRRHPVLVFTEHCTTNRRITKKWLRPVEVFIYRKYKAIIGVSENVSLILKNWLPELKNKIVTINNGVNIEKFSSAQKFDSSYFEKNWGIKPGDIKLLMASRFFAQKDHDTVVKALADLPPNFHILFAGGGERVETVRELARSLGVENRVHFLGFRTDIAQLMKSADINILSSFFEGLSGVTLESLATGNPFLGSDIPGISDVVPDKNFIFEKNNAADLAKKLIAITSNESLKNKMMQDASMHVKHFDIWTMMERHLELYQQLLSEKH